ncbi:oligosaccharide flippase family protein [Bacillus sp. ISL-47]|uniref:lipopolysaccharide biosynthesis protein n=1 Tax=Bacillus sp. ISL-47 TaxID=2819130 RepID=UPI001BEAC06E|nr:oligosaccharide flippase family protein [Bacillus sp. ISL-47]MBT2689226.1 oligosaccharide flippase family protein [Bacillus sp. ISL-47]
MIKNLFKGSFIKNVLLITGSTAFAQIISISLSPIITRIYPPDEYGILTVYTSLLTVIAVIASLKYEMGIPIAADDKKAVNLLGLSLITLFVVTLLLTVILFLFGDVILGLLNGDVLIEYKFLIPLGVFFIGIYNIFTQWSYRRQDYKSISATKISQSIFQNLINISLGLLKLGPIGLIIGRIFGQGAGITTLSKPFINKEKQLISAVNLKSIIWCAKRYKRFPIYSAPGQFLNIVGLQLPVLFMTSIYGSGVIGLYGLANTIVNIPMSLIGNSIADVFYGEASRIGRSDPRRLKDLSIKLLKKSVLIGLFPLIVMFLFGPNLFALIFGESWYKAGEFARIITFLVFTRLIFTPITRIFNIYDKQKESLILDGLRVFLVLIVFGVSEGLTLNSYWSIGIYTITMSFVYLISYLYAHMVLNSKIKEY